MFDTIIKERGPSHIQVDLTEHKAPTDDSIRLYHEIREKAIQDILGCIQVQDNVLNFAIISSQTIDYETVYHCVLSVNGKKHNFNITIPHILVDSTGYGVDKVIRVFLNGLCEELSKIIVSDSLVSLIGPIFSGRRRL